MTLIIAMTFINPLRAYGESIMNGVSDLSTARFSVICREIADGEIKEGNFNQGLCVGIILGVEDNANYDKKVCVPKRITINERIQVITSYIATQPKRMNESFASLVFDAMFEKWPCSK